MKKSLVILSALILAGSLSACRFMAETNTSQGPDKGTVTASPSASATTASQAPNPSTQAQQNPISYETPTKDRMGNEIQLPERMEKIVSLSSQFTQILVDLGLGDKIVAIDTYSAPMEGIKEGLPAFDILSPDMEMLLSLEPDVVFATTMSIVAGNDPFKPLKDMGICVVYTPVAETLADILLDLEFFFKATGSVEKGVKMVNSFNQELMELKELASGIQDKKKVYFEISALPSLYSFGNSVYLNEVIELVGGENIFKDEKGWLAVTEESVIQKNPDVILTNNTYIEKAEEEIKNRKGWEEVTAIKNGAIYVIDNGSSSISNHLLIKAVKEMAVAIYPEVFK